MHYKMSYNREALAARPAVKSTIPAFQPLPGAPGRRRARPPQGPDPEDLTRRLLDVISERKAYVERKKRLAKTEAQRQAAQPPKQQTEESVVPVAQQAEHQVPLAQVGAEASSATAVPVLEPAPEEEVEGERQPPVPDVRASLPPPQPMTGKPRTLHLRARPKTSHAELGRSQSTRDLHRSSSRHEATKTTEDGPSDGYHHVPQEAARQFVRTATAEAMVENPLRHRLSKHAMNLPDRTAPSSDPTIQRSRSKTLRKSQSHREMPHERSNFQRTIALEFAVDEEEEEESWPAFRHTYGPTRSGHHHRREAKRRMSTGDLLNQPAFPHKPPNPHDLLPVEPINRTHIDWSQSDEPLPKTRPRISPLLRKADSIWHLRGRLGSFNKHAKDERSPLRPGNGNTAAVAATTTVADAPKSPMAGFFARFKR